MTVDGDLISSIYDSNQNYCSKILDMHPTDPAPQGFSPSPVPQRGPGAAAAQPNPLKSKLAERLGWTGDGDEFDSDDRSRGKVHFLEEILLESHYIMFF